MEGQLVSLLKTPVIDRPSRCRHLDWSIDRINLAKISSYLLVTELIKTYCSKLSWSSFGFTKICFTNFQATEADSSLDLTRAQYKMTRASVIGTEGRKEHLKSNNRNANHTFFICVDKFIRRQNENTDVTNGLSSQISCMLYSWTYTISVFLKFLFRRGTPACENYIYIYTRWFKYDRNYLCVNKSQFVPVIFEPPCIYIYIY
jgi:hypothetical protein